MLFKEVRQIALALPETEERLSWDTPTFFVRNKVFARLLEDGERMAIKHNELERHALVAQAPKVFSIPPHYANYPMIVLQLATIQPNECQALLEEAWRFVAPRKLLEQFNANA